MKTMDETVNELLNDWYKFDYPETNESILRQAFQMGITRGRLMELDPENY